MRRETANKLLRLVAVAGAALALLATNGTEAQSPQRASEATVLDPVGVLDSLLLQAALPAETVALSPLPGAVASWQATDGAVASLLLSPPEPGMGLEPSVLVLERLNQAGLTRGLVPAKTSEVRLFGLPGVMREYRTIDDSNGRDGVTARRHEGVVAVADTPAGALVLLAQSTDGADSARELARRIAAISLPGLALLRESDPTTVAAKLTGIRDGRKLVVAVLDDAGLPVIWRGIPIQLRQLGTAERPIRPGQGMTLVADSSQISVFGGGIDPIPGANRLEVLGPSGNLLQGEIVEPPAGLVAPIRPTKAPPDRRATKNNGS